ncbi:DUF4355 domain-containing protein [Alkalihalophilus marmarensis]|uniref:DUF4355 domain-containing protein n=1 Tax=Alkalihalophilus marmarensis TaxID=521377 RepID=UPI002E20DBFE|nr:DUF4355 domain-containing protein [Alkalihalophilus marmarensis]
MTKAIGYTSIKKEKKKMFLPLRFQYFNSEGGDDGGKEGGAQGAGEGQGDEKEAELPKTPEELKKLLQSNSDKRVTEALQTAKEKWQKEFEQKLETEKAEAEKLAKMSSEEKEKALLDKSKADIEAREKAIAQKELKLETINILNDRKLPISFADLLLAEDAEKTKGNVDVFEKAFREAVDVAVTDRLKSTPPTVGGGGSNAGSVGKQLAEQRSKSLPDIEKARLSYFQ